MGGAGLGGSASAPARMLLAEVRDGSAGRALRAAVPHGPAAHRPAYGAIIGHRSATPLIKVPNDGPIDDRDGGIASSNAEGDGAYG
jgi:hypothetical protein